MVDSPEKLRVSDWVEVRSLEDIISTLDENASVESLPFMPEMAAYCGKRFKVVKSAHKTCDPTGVTDMRRMKDAVHLATRCDGSGHDGCQAGCLIFWKTAWLKAVEGPAQDEARELSPASGDFSLLVSATRHQDPRNGKITYSCQATQLVNATVEWKSVDIRQYVEDVQTKNVTIGLFTRYVGEYFLRLAAKRAVSLLRRDSAQGAGQATPPTPRKSDPGPILDLQPGDLVEVRPRDEIVATLDPDQKTGGLSFDKEMFAFCGKTFRVTRRIKKIIDERTGRMINFGAPCVVLDQLHCAGIGNRNRLFCPRSPLWFWREAWLKRAPAPNA